MVSKRSIYIYIYINTHTESMGKEKPILPCTFERVVHKLLCEISNSITLT